VRSAWYRAALAALSLLVGMAAVGPVTPAGAQFPPDNSAFLLTALGGRATLVQWRGLGGADATYEVSRYSSSGRITLPPPPPGAASAAVDILPDDLSGGCYTVALLIPMGGINVYSNQLCLVPGFATGAAPGHLTIWLKRIGILDTRGVGAIFWDPVPGATAYVVLTVSASRGTVSVQALPGAATSAGLATEAGSVDCYLVFPVQGGQALGRSDAVCGWAASSF
jgi:hypothetical protein